MATTLYFNALDKHKYFSVTNDWNCTQNVQRDENLMQNADVLFVSFNDHELYVTCQSMKF